MALLKYSIQLASLLTGVNIGTAGGTVYVAQNGLPDKQVIYDASGAAMTNPFAPTRGKITFYTATTVASVDLYIMTPAGHFLVRQNVTPSGPNEFLFDTGRMNQTAVIPFAIANTTANVETDTGFDLPLYAAVQPNPVIRTVTIDTGITILGGLLSSETAGDADGFFVGVSVATAGLAKATILNGGKTIGALLTVQDSANAGDLTHEQHVVTGANARSISYTLSSGADTAAGFIVIDYSLRNVI